jgi:hypothetical protein
LAVLGSCTAQKKVVAISLKGWPLPALISTENVICIHDEGEVGLIASKLKGPCAIVTKVNPFTMVQLTGDIGK